MQTLITYKNFVAIRIVFIRIQGYLRGEVDFTNTFVLARKGTERSICLKRKIKKKKKRKK